MGKFENTLKHIILKTIEIYGEIWKHFETHNFENTLKHMIWKHFETYEEIWKQFETHNFENHWNLWENHWQGATIRGLITEVKQPWAQSILGWVTIQDTVLVAKDVIVTCHVPLWLMSYEHTRGSQSAP